MMNWLTTFTNVKKIAHNFVKNMCHKITHYFGWSWSWPEVYELREGLHSSQPEEGPAPCRPAPRSVLQSGFTMPWFSRFTKPRIWLLV